ncbi:MAG: hypothetical protein V2I27_07980 [Erythrobacter sp.]|jgi:hypothetical protein|nr:hypothetical protein [Erythrobacter sp.]
MKYARLHPFASMRMKACIKAMVFQATLAGFGLGLRAESLGRDASAVPFVGHGAKIGLGRSPVKLRVGLEAAACDTTRVTGGGFVQLVRAAVVSLTRAASTQS